MLPLPDMRALFIGRFQPFHNGHLEVVREIAEEYVPIIVIGSAGKSHTLEDPFTAGERYLMISESLKSADIQEFAIIPVINVNRYGIWVSHIRTLVPSFDLVISNNSLTRRLFSEYGYMVRSPKRFSREVFRGSYIRERILEGERWDQLVPKDVTKIINDIGGVERMLELSQGEDPEAVD